MLAFVSWVCNMHRGCWAACKGSGRGSVDICLKLLRHDEPVVDTFRDTALRPFTGLPLFNLCQYVKCSMPMCLAAGKVKLGVQRLGMWDASGLLGSTAGTEQGAVLSMWRPDEGWGERDAFIVANAKLGASTSTHHIYEHLDVMVHPLGVHLSETMGRNFWVSRL